MKDGKHTFYKLQVKVDDKDWKDSVLNTTYFRYGKCFEELGIDGTYDLNKAKLCLLTGQSYFREERWNNKELKIVKVILEKTTYGINSDDFHPFKTIILTPKRNETVQLTAVGKFRYKDNQFVFFRRRYKGVLKRSVEELNNNDEDVKTICDALTDYDKKRFIYILNNK